MGWFGDIVTEVTKWNLKQDVQDYYANVGGVIGAEFTSSREHAEVIPALAPGGKTPIQAQEEFSASTDELAREWEAQRNYGTRPDGLIGYIGQGAAIAGAWVAGATVGLVSGFETEAAPPASSLLVTPVPGGHFQSTRETVSNVRGILDVRNIDASSDLIYRQNALGSQVDPLADQNANPGAPNDRDKMLPDYWTAGKLPEHSTGYNPNGDPGANTHDVRLSANQKRAKAIKVAEALKRSDAETRALADARRARRLGTPVEVVTERREAGLPVAPLAVTAAITTAPALPSAGAIPVQGASMLPTTLGIPQVGPLGASAESLLDSAKTYYEANKPMILGATTATVLGGAAVATAVALASDDSKPTRRTTTRRTSRSAKAPRKPRAGSEGARLAKEDRSGRVSVKKTWRGQKVHWTDAGQPYVIRQRNEGPGKRKGMARFIAK